MTESPLKKILGMKRLFVTGAPFLPFLGISVHTYWTFSITIFMCRSNAFTFPSNFLLFLRAINTSLLALTDLVRSEKGPMLKFYYCAFFSCSISTLIIIDHNINFHHRKYFHQLNKISESGFQTTCFSLPLCFSL